MLDHLDSVKEYLRQMEGWRKKAIEKDDKDMAEIYDKRLGFLRLIADEVEHLRRVTRPIPASYGDLSDLPPELVKELTGIKVDDLEQQLFTIIKTGGKEVDLDAILIELWRRFQVSQTRKFLQNKLWRMAQKEIVYSVPGRKGVYTAINPDDFEELLGSPSAPATAATGWGQAATTEGGFADDLDDDIPF